MIWAGLYEQGHQVVPVRSVRDTDQLTPDATEDAACRAPFPETFWQIALGRFAHRQAVAQARSAASSSASGKPAGMAGKADGTAGGKVRRIFICIGLARRHGYRDS